MARIRWVAYGAVIALFGFLALSRDPQPDSTPVVMPPAPVRIVQAPQAEDPNTLKFLSRTFVPEPVLAIPPSPQPDLPRRRLVLQFERDRLDAFRASAKANDVTILQSVPPNAVVVSTAPDTPLEKLDGARAVFALKAADRLSPQARELADGPPTTVQVFVKFFRDVSKDEATSTVAEPAARPCPSPRFPTTSF